MKAAHDRVRRNKNLIGDIQGDSSPDRQIVPGNVLFKWNLIKSGMSIRSDSFARREAGNILSWKIVTLAFRVTPKIPKFLALWAIISFWIGTLPPQSALTFWTASMKMYVVTRNMPCKSSLTLYNIGTARLFYHYADYRSCTGCHGGCRHSVWYSWRNRCDDKREILYVPRTLDVFGRLFLWQ